jgi:hypothetical protein
MADLSVGQSIAVAILLIRLQTTFSNIFWMGLAACKTTR